MKEIRTHERENNVAHVIKKEELSGPDGVKMGIV